MPNHPKADTDEHARPPIALTIAGSDSGGGAGIQADLKTFHAFGVFGTSVVTAITAQNTVGVTAVHSVPTDTVRAQVRAVASDLRPAATKSGMLATAELARTVASCIEEEGLENYVLDPVMVASSGDRLLDEDAVEAVRNVLIPLCAVVTPNLPEARILTGLSGGAERMEEMARALVEGGAGAALVKGGHLSGESVLDVFFDGADYREWRRPRLDTRNTHGTGCTLSAAIAAELARGSDLAAATERALDFVQRAIATAPGLGAGHGPLNHFASIDRRDVSG